MKDLEKIFLNPLLIIKLLNSYSILNYVLKHNFMNYEIEVHPSVIVIKNNYVKLKKYLDEQLNYEVLTNTIL